VNIHGNDCGVRPLQVLRSENSGEQFDPPLSSSSSASSLLSAKAQTRTGTSLSPMSLSSSSTPPDPSLLCTESELQRQADRLVDWWDGKDRVVCISGAGLSTESGIPDYRGHNGSYHKGHKPMIHDQFMKSEMQRRRYWARGMVGWKSFDTRTPNLGHYALARLERLGKLGVRVEGQPCDGNGGGVNNNNKSRPHQTVALITQNVDGLHRRAGSRHVVELHGRTDQLVCMSCGAARDRQSFHSELEASNREWLDAALAEPPSPLSDRLRPDGDAVLKFDNYHALRVPACKCCSDGFMKPDVVFFGDTVPSSRVALCRAAVEASDGVLVVGSSLAVHSAFRHVRAAAQLDIPVAILNVGETRAEQEGLDVLKIEAPAGRTLDLVASHLATSS